MRENHDGYHVVSLKCELGWRSIGVHRLVATAFIPRDDPDRNEVNHIDFNRKNNHYKNLEWVTHKENVAYSVNAGRHPKFMGMDNPNYGNDVLSKKYKEHPELAKEKQSRPGKQNGRSRQTDLFYNNEFVASFDYYALCCEYLRKKFGYKSISYISNAINNAIKNNTDFKGYTVVKY